MCTASSQKFLPDALTNLDGTSVSVPGKQSTGIAMRAVDVPLGDGLAGSSRTAILTRRERIRRAVEGE